MLSQDERRLLVEQAILLIEALYVHLPLKRAMHAVDPEQRLKLLRHRLETLSEPAFHAELIAIFTSLRDLHTNYVLPEPFRNRTAYLPFRIAEYFHNDERRYVVTEVKPGAEDRAFKTGIELTHWNGVPIDRAVQNNADREAGSNSDARHARGLAAMTIRPLAVSLPPDEEWVVVTFKHGKQRREKRFEWRVFQSKPGGGNDPLAAAGELATVLGLDAKAELERQARKVLFSPESVVIARRARQQIADSSTAATAGEQLDFSKISQMPDVFAFRTVKTPSGQFGYIRIFTFLVLNDVAFVNEFIRIASLLPQKGLILDVRGNGGGNIIAGERLLQILTPHPIEAERFYFLSSPLTLRICNHNAEFGQWKQSIDQSVETGTDFSNGFSLRPPASYNDTGQRYQGPVVLLTDARCYSTTDIFSAGFQDHQIGKILGTSPRTGAGGANVWTHDFLRQSLPESDSPFKTLPAQASFRVAVRRSTRVGPRAGELVEDLGVTADFVHRPTRKDVLNNNVDLINRAAEILAQMPVHSLTGQLSSKQSLRTLTLKTRNITRVDILHNGRPDRSIDVADGVSRVDLPAHNLSEGVLELRGFRDDQLVVSHRIALGSGT